MTIGVRPATSSDVRAGGSGAVSDGRRQGRAAGAWAVRRAASSSCRPSDAGDDRGDADRAGPDEEAPARPVGHRSRSVAPRGTPPRPSSHDERLRCRRSRPTPATTACGDRRRPPAGRRARRGTRRRRRRRIVSAAAANDRRATIPSAGADQQRDDDDQDLEGELVVRPEERDDEVLRAGRLEVDDDLADRRDERRARRAAAGEQLRDAEGGGDRDDAGDRVAGSRPRAGRDRRLGGSRVDGGRAHGVIVHRCATSA